MSYNNNAVLLQQIDRDRRDIDVASDIARYVPDASPFAIFLMRAKKKATRTNEFIWWDEEPFGYWTKINNASGYAAASDSGHGGIGAEQTIKVDSSTIVKPADVLRVASTGEIMLVTEVVNATQIKVLRGYAGTTNAVIPHQAWLVRLGNAMEENSRAPESKMKQPSKHYNYTQTVRTPFDASMQVDKEALHTQSERARLRKSKSIDHRMDLERIALFGVRKEDETQNRRMTGGVLSFISTNYFDVGDHPDHPGFLSEDDFELFCEMIFAHGVKEQKLLVCSPRLITVLNTFGRDKIRSEVGEHTYGCRINTYMSAHGDLKFIKSKTLENEYAHMGICVDMDNIAYRVKRDTRLKTNIQENDRDGWRDEYLTEFGMEVRLEKTHGVIDGVIGVAV